MCSIEGDDIVIRIPISALPHACQYAWDNKYGFEQHSLYISNIDEFSNDFVNELNSEGTGRSGDTIIDKMLDEVVIRATDNGAFGIEEKE